MAERQSQVLDLTAVGTDDVPRARQATLSYERGCLRVGFGGWNSSHPGSVNRSRSFFGLVGPIGQEPFRSQEELEKHGRTEQVMRLSWRD